MSRRTFVLAVLLAGLLLRIALMILARGALIDDAYISLRYGQNLFSGNGLVYNAGEHALGAPPLYAALLGLAWRVSDAARGGESLVGYLITSLNLLLVAAAGVLLWRIVDGEGVEPGAPPGPRPSASWLAPLTPPYLPVALFALYVPFVDNSTTGMETTLFVTLQLLSLHAFRRRRISLGATALGLGLLVRAEGALWIVAILLTEVLQGRSPRLRSLAPLFGIALGWGIVSTLYYGSPIPLHVMSKSGWFVGGQGGPTVLDQLWNVLQAFTLLPFGALGAQAAGTWVSALAIAGLILGAAAFTAGCISLWRRNEFNFTFCLFFVLCVAFYVVGRGATWPSWYAIPPGLAFFVVASYGISFLLSRSGALRASGGSAGYRSQPIALILMTLLLLVSSVIVWTRVRAPYYRAMEGSYAATGRYLRANSEPADSLLLWEVGCIGFVAGRYTQEAAGIVSPRVFHLLRDDPAHAGTQDLITRFRPRFVVLPVRGRDLANPPFVEWLGERYEPVFTTPMYRTFRRLEPAAPRSALPSSSG